MRKWRTNSAELRNMMSEEDVLKVDDEKVLGIKWNHTEDTMHMSVKDLFETAKTVTPTKRSILKFIASIYDPVGYLAPISVSLRLLFQEMWLKDISLDDPIGEELEKNG